MAIAERRTVIFRALAAVAAAWAGLRAAAPKLRRDWRRLNVDAPTAGRFADTELHVWLLRDASGRLAVQDRLCPHQGCIVQARSDDLWCPCHGSVFGLDGSRRAGPAPHGLAWYPVRRNGDGIWVDLARPRSRAYWI